MSFDYNTSRKHLLLPEYGRNIQKMVDHIKTCDDREERNKLAKAVVAVMGNLNPHLRDISDFRHKLWDHLAIIANFELDIDFPYDIPQRETFMEKPKRVPYGTGRMKFRHYGKSIELMVNSVVAMPDSEAKTARIKMVANQMKKLYLAWNRDTADDEVILKDLDILAEGKIDISQIKLSEARELINKSSGISNVSNTNNNMNRRKKISKKPYRN